MSGNEKNRNFRILVVDDDDSTRSLLSSVLAAEGYECLTANSVASADVILRQEPIQLALLDLYLGTANGLNVLDLIKVLQPQCACVIMTAHTSVETVTKSLGSGAIEYLGKPLLIDDLLALVRRVQASKRASERDHRYGRRRPGDIHHWAHAEDAGGLSRHCARSPDGSQRADSGRKRYRQRAGGSRAARPQFPRGEAICSR